MTAPARRTSDATDLHHPRPALDLPVGALLHVVRAQAPPVRLGQVQIGQRVRLGLPGDAGGPGAALPEHLACKVVHGPDLVGVLGAEDRGHYPVHAALELPASGLPRAVAHGVDDAALPGGPWNVS